MPQIKFTVSPHRKEILLGLIRDRISAAEARLLRLQNSAHSYKLYIAHAQEELIELRALEKIFN